ncbi:MAG: hypothetical protein JRC77_01110 [Deltaproteobacteria bacterium]|nr:hypothetical protein [Deltaproteobacteria bacterium]
MFRNPIEKIHLCFAGIALALAGMMVSFDVWTAMALGTLLAAFNLHLLLGSTEKLFAGELQGARGWSAVFILRFTLFAAAIGIAIFSGIDPLGLILGFSTIVPSVVVATWKARPPVLETAGKGSRS